MDFQRLPNPSLLNKRVQIVYYLSRRGLLEQPHLLEVPASSSDGLICLRDVKKRLAVVRGESTASSFSWSCKRSYRDGYVWQDLCDDDLILPSNGCEYVLKGSMIGDQKSSARCPRKSKELTDRPTNRLPNMTTRNAARKPGNYPGDYPAMQAKLTSCGILNDDDSGDCSFVESHTSSDITFEFGTVQDNLTSLKHGHRKGVKALQDKLSPGKHGHRKGLNHAKAQVTAYRVYTKLASPSLLAQTGAADAATQTEEEHHDSLLHNASISKQKQTQPVEAYEIMELDRGESSPPAAYSTESTITSFPSSSSSSRNLFTTIHDPMSPLSGIQNGCSDQERPSADKDGRINVFDPKKATMPSSPSNHVELEGSPTPTQVQEVQCSTATHRKGKTCRTSGYTVGFLQFVSCGGRGLEVKNQQESVANHHDTQSLCFNKAAANVTPLGDVPNYSTLSADSISCASSSQDGPTKGTKKNTDQMPSSGLRGNPAAEVEENPGSSKAYESGQPSGAAGDSQEQSGRKSFSRRYWAKHHQKASRTLHNNVSLLEDWRSFPVFGGRLSHDDNSDSIRQTVDATASEFTAQIPLSSSNDACAGVKYVSTSGEIEVLCGQVDSLPLPKNDDEEEAVTGSSSIDRYITTRHSVAERKLKGKQKDKFTPYQTNQKKNYDEKIGHQKSGNDQKEESNIENIHN